MTQIERDFSDAVAAVSGEARRLPTRVEAARALDDAALIATQHALADIKRMVDACSSLLAGEISHRSRRELGYSGLAQREGFRSAEALLQKATGSSSRDATTLVRVGVMMHDAMTAGETEVPPSWENLVGRAVSDGSITIQSAGAIRSGLDPRPIERDGRGMAVELLAVAATRLIADAQTLDVDSLFRRARDVRDELDAAGIADRERAIYDERSIRRVRRPNGVSRYIVDPDLESGAFWDDLYDSLTSPRRGGVRFVDDNQRAWADAVAKDPRTVEQYVHDSVTELLRLSATADDEASRRVVGGRAPAVRVLSTEASLATRTGHGRIEGVGTPVSIETVERHACASGTVRIGFDEHGHVLDLGREQRLYTPRQRIALAARDGGCRHPDCDRPPTWTEAHHIQHWKRDYGRTDIADGILLCRFHHMLMHNNHWEIERRGDGYWLIPPPDIDRAQAPRPMPSKSAALGDLQRSVAEAVPLGQVG